MNNTDKQYLDGARLLLEQATLTENRTATSAYKLFGYQMKFDLREGLPLLTTKKLALTNIIRELLWFLDGDTNINYLKDNNCNIWNEWATPTGELGPVYGAQWRRWESIKIPKSQDEYESLISHQGYKHIGGFTSCDYTVRDCPVVYKQIDQIAEVMDTLKNNPTDRRMIVTAYNPSVKPTTTLKPHENAAINLQALPPCHMLFQLNTTPIPELERHESVVSQIMDEIMSDDKWMDEAHKRHAAGEDPYLVQARNAAESALNYLMTSENVTMQDMLTNDYNAPTHFLDMEMYQRSADWFLGVPYNIASYSILLMMFAQQANMVARNFVHSFGDFHLYDNHIEQIKSQLEQPGFNLPTLTINKAESIDRYTIDDFVLSGYQHGPFLKGDVAV